MKKTDLQKRIAILKKYGFFAGKRDPHINPKFTGQFMILECGIDPYAIVGNNLQDLVLEALDHLEIPLRSALESQQKSH